MSSNILGIQLSDKDKKRFWFKVDIKGQEECWNWLGSTNGGRYGKFKCNGVWYRSNRVALVISSGKDIPNNLWALHKCDNSFCVNPNHLYIGTPSNNNLDRENRNRAPNAGRPKGISDLIISIVRDLANEGYTQNDISRKLLMSQQRVSYILNIERYRNNV
jgi:hypothetical protein